MVIPSEIRSKYLLIEPQILEAKKIVDSILFNYCQENNYAYTSRKKELSSLSEKFETGRYSSWDEIDDMIASTIIIPHLNEESKVMAFLKKQFIDLNVKNKKSFPLEPEVFRFDATRVYCKLKFSEQGVNDILKNQIVEIQIRTALEHAWSVATHPLTYKSDVIDWEMSRLVAQLKANIEQLDMLIVGASDIKKHIISRGWTGVEFKKKIIAKTIELLDRNIIPVEHKPKDLSRFSENILKVFESISDLRSHYKKKNFKELLNYYEQSLIELSGKFPMSISLYQVVIGQFIEGERIKNNVKISLLITEGMKSIFPKSILISKTVKI